MAFTERPGFKVIRLPAGERPAEHPINDYKDLGRGGVSKRALDSRKHALESDNR